MKRLSDPAFRERVRGILADPGIGLGSFETERIADMVFRVYRATVYAAVEGQ